MWRGRRSKGLARQNSLMLSSPELNIGFLFAGTGLVRDIVFTFPENDGPFFFFKHPPELIVVGSAHGFKFYHFCNNFLQFTVDPSSNLILNDLRNDHSPMKMMPG